MLICPFHEARHFFMFGNPLGSNWFRQESLIDAETSGWKFDQQDIYIISKYLHLLITTGKIVIVQWTPLNKVIKAITVYGTNQHMPPEKDTSPLWPACRPKMCILNIITRKTSDKNKLLYKITGLCSSKSEGQKNKETEVLFQIKGPKSHGNWTQCVSLDCVLDQTFLFGFSSFFYYLFFFSPKT